jgi:hypothetical protein
VLPSVPGYRPMGRLLGMRLREIDAVGWLRVLTNAVVVPALWVVIVAGEWDMPLVVLLGVALVIAAGSAVIGLRRWARMGGYAVLRSLERWVHDGPDPTAASNTLRIRYLLRRSDRGMGTAWLTLGGAALFLVIGGSGVRDGDAVPDTLLQFLTAASVGIDGVVQLVSARRWMPRIRQLLAETQEQRGSAPWFEPWPER